MKQNVPTPAEALARYTTLQGMVATADGNLTDADKEFVRNETSRLAASAAEALKET